MTYQIMNPYNNNRMKNPNCIENSTTTFTQKSQINIYQKLSDMLKPEVNNALSYHIEYTVNQHGF
jgi:hypothetical protein